MGKQYKPNDFNRKCQIGDTKTVTTPTGSKVEKFDDTNAVSLWFASKMRSLAFQFQIAGTEQADTFEIVIRHNPSVSKKNLVKIDDLIYTIYNISSDESTSFNRVDILTLKLKKKGV